MFHQLTNSSTALKWRLQFWAIQKMSLGKSSFTNSEEFCLMHLSFIRWTIIPLRWGTAGPSTRVLGPKLQEFPFLSRLHVSTLDSTSNTKQGIFEPELVLPSNGYPPNDDGATEDHHEPDADNAPGRVVERQRVVENRILDGAEVAQVVHPGAVEVETRVLDHSSFRQS